MFNLPSNIIFKSLIYNDEENNIIEKIKDLKKENKFDKGVYF